MSFNIKKNMQNEHILNNHFEKIEQLGPHLIDIYAQCTFEITQWLHEANRTTGPKKFESISAFFDVFPNKKRRSFRIGARIFRAYGASKLDFG